jgi:phosphoglucomutase/phosphomannomutase
MGQAALHMDAPRVTWSSSICEQGNSIAVHSSGTEPKVKFYMFTYVAPELLADLQDTKNDMARRLATMESDLKAVADAV